MNPFALVIVAICGGALLGLFFGLVIGGMAMLGSQLKIPRLVERTAAVISTAALSPVLVSIALGLKLILGGAILHRRLVTDEESGGTYQRFEFRTDHRAGRFLRRYYIDQMPTLINVGKGECHYDSPFAPRTPQQQIADLSGAENQEELDYCLFVNARGHLNDLGPKGQAIVHRFFMLESCASIRREDDEESDWNGPQEWLNAAMDELIADLEEWPVTPKELDNAIALYPAMTEIYNRAHVRAHSMSQRARHGAFTHDYNDGLMRSVAAGRRTCARTRTSRGSSVRVAGSRRVTSRSAGGGSSGSDDSSKPGGPSGPPRRQHPHNGHRFARPLLSTSPEGC